ncbi:hypothetical protein NE237_026819 [Protea cynaroides]|uniref:Bifunctional inhibitor/plant lipid transfer protein/seed storage helical domain-containing protein n=1 Tax=Protea cynaroides TaxID=273540 RepID=A0A9Q0GLD2_9MAGN|nr:hypothetical protein NE237_026819 [Protea cynaroides]
MARLATIGVLLVALVFMAEASLYQAIETDVEENQSRRDMCRQELRGRRFRSCQDYLQRGRRGYRGVMSRFGGSGESLDDCCRELRDVDRMCRCDAIEQARDDAQMRGDRRRGYEEQRRRYRGMDEDRDMRRRAENLPSLCRMDSPRHCEMGY